MTLTPTEAYDAELARFGVQWTIEIKLMSAAYPRPPRLSRKRSAAGPVITSSAGIASQTKSCRRCAQRTTRSCDELRNRCDTSDRTYGPGAAGCA